MSEDHSCGNCGSDNVTGVTRVVGYFAEIPNMNQSKLGEIRDRQKGNYRIDGAGASPLEFSYDRDGVYLAGKDGCQRCTGAYGVIQNSLKKTGLEGDVEVHVMKIVDHDENYNPKDLAKAVLMNVPLQNIPAVVVVKNDKIVYRYSTTYGGEKASGITPKKLIPVLEQFFGKCESADLKTA